MEGLGPTRTKLNLDMDSLRNSVHKLNASETIAFEHIDDHHAEFFVVEHDIGFELPLGARLVRILSRHVAHCTQDLPIYPLRMPTALRATMGIAVLARVQLAPACEGKSHRLDQGLCRTGTWGLTFDMSGQFPAGRSPLETVRSMEGLGRRTLDATDLARPEPNARRVLEALNSNPCMLPTKKGDIENFQAHV